MGMRSPIVAVGHDVCIPCVRWRLYEMHAAAQVRVSALLRVGDLIILVGEHRWMYPSVCLSGRRCTGMADEGFEAFLDRIRNQDHPDFGQLSWNGRTRQVTETVQFEANGCPEGDEVVRERALRYLQTLTEEERAAAELDVVFRERRPVRAVLRARTSELSPERLKEIRRQAGL
jgi:hypothetical protein